MEVPSPVVVFECHCAETHLGESVLVTGCIPELGNWQIQWSTPMITSAKEFPLWRSKIFQLVSVNPGDEIEFKFLIHRPDENVTPPPPRWETCANRRFRCPKPGQLARVVARFGNDSSVAVNITEISSANAFDGRSSNTYDELISTQGEDDDRLTHPPPFQHHPSIDVTSPPKRVGAVHPDEEPASSIGKSRPQTAEDGSACLLSCTYHRSDLVCQYMAKDADRSFHLIASLNNNYGSLRQKVSAIRDLLESSSKAWRLTHTSRQKCWEDKQTTLELLRTFAYSSILLSWVSTSVVKCTEDGGHHRPNQVALIAKDVVNICENWKYRNAIARRTTNEHIWEADLMDYFCRVMQPSLPSYKPSFTSAVPLTRIRDIAHRNDISQDLKREIKTTLQNKLHRCAGPEDLIRSKELLDRFHRDRENYPPDFIREFEIFHSELTEFFNADGLEERLNKLLKAHPETNPWRVNAINRFIANKFTFESDRRNTQYIHHMIRSSTHLREALMNEIFNCGFPVIEGQDDDFDAEFFQQDPSHGQILRLAEIQTEGYLFTLYSRFINEVEHDIINRFESLSSTIQLRWLLLWLSLLSDALKNLAISGFAAQYCYLLIKEIRSVLESDSPPLMDRLFLLHVASLFRRALRLVQIQTDLLLSLLPPKGVESFARQINVDTAMGRIYTEGQIRASLPFQISRLATAVLKAVEVKALKKSPFQIICDGRPVGRVIFAKDLESCSGADPNLDGEIILVLSTVDGDEELDGLSERLSMEANKSVRIVGLIALKDVPALSHIGVRARQIKLPFVSVTSASLDHEDFRSAWHGKMARLDPETSSLHTTAIPLCHVDTNSSNAPTTSLPIKSPVLKKGSLVLHPTRVTSFEVLRGTDIQASNCGAKAAACQELCTTLQSLQLRNEDQSHEVLGTSRFLAPQCLALPFGTMDVAFTWSQNQVFGGEVQQLLLEIPSRPPGKELSILLQRFRWILENNCHLTPEAGIKLSQCIASHLLSPEILRQLQANSSHVEHVMVRSSSNCEDLSEVSGAGLYDSVLAPLTWEGPAPDMLDISEVWRAIKQVWSSLYSERAVLSRRANRIRNPSMAVLIQPLIPATWCFIAHTQCPRGISATESHQPYVEMARGLGEALASGGADLGGGKPTQLLLGSTDSECVVLNMWDMFGRYKAVPDKTQLERHFTILRKIETTNEYWQYINKLLGGLKGLERLFGKPQDIEGCIVEDDEGKTEVYILQSRPQQT